MNVLVITEAELRQIVGVDQAAIEAIENAFTWLAQGKVSMPPIMHIEIKEHQGDVDIKSAYVKGLDRFAVKIGAGFFQNHKLGFPNSPAMMVVLSSKTGMTEAILLDNAYLTDVRTGAAGAVAAKHLAPKKVSTAGVIGAGAQGRYQMVGLKNIRDYKRLLVYDKDEQRLAKYVEEMGPVLNAEVVAAADAGEVITQAQAVVTCTPSRKAYVQPDWIHPGLHITAMGADLPEKQEIEPDVVKLADILVCDRKSQSFSMGEFHYAFEAGLISESSPVTELGDITAGLKPGRQTEEQFTICDLSGTGVQDTAIANIALQQAKKRSLGVEIEINNINTSDIRCVV